MTIDAEFCCGGGGYHRAVSALAAPGESRRGILHFGVG